MEPIVLIHGYSAEGSGTSAAAISSIYGDLPAALRAQFGAPAVLELDLSRYISLDDGITVDDISRAMDRALRDSLPHLLRSGFNVIIHSTGALVVRNWIRRFSPLPSPIRRLAYLAGANFGSGWAHIGRGQLAKWARLVFQGGTERGVQVLDALELGSDWTLDLHLHFLDSRLDMHDEFQVMEFCIVGTQADVGWFSAPIRYAKEDGADGVVRVCSCNVNFNHIRITPTPKAYGLTWKEAQTEQARNLQRKGERSELYEARVSHPGWDERPVVPFAVVHGCAHSGKEMGVVTGSEPRAQVMKLLTSALACDRPNWPSRVTDFDRETQATYNLAAWLPTPAWWKPWIEEPKAQYDPHAQVIFRVRDQNGRPIEHFDIFFDSVTGRTDTSLPIGKLFEDKHVNEKTPNIITFFLRIKPWDGQQWTPKLPLVHGCFLEITATEPETDEILYVPLRINIDPPTLESIIEPHRTTIVDVVLLRIPSPGVFRTVPG